MPLQPYNALLPYGSSDLKPSQIPEILISRYTIANGTTSITISDPAFNLTNYKGIHVRVNNPRGSSTSAGFTGLPIKNGVAVSGTYNATVDASAATTGYGTQSSTGSLLSIGGGLNLTNAVSKIDFYLSVNGLTYLFDVFTGSTSVRRRGTINFPTPLPQSFTASDFIGLTFGVDTGTFTGGTIDVYGEV
jgi:hypothetical protein